MLIYFSVSEMGLSELTDNLSVWIREILGSFERIQLFLVDLSQHILYSRTLTRGVDFRYLRWEKINANLTVSELIFHIDKKYIEGY